MTTLREAIMALPPGDRLQAALDAIDDLTGARGAAVAALAAGHGLTLKEARVLAVLNAAWPRVASKESLFTACWGHDSDVGERITDIYVMKLRAKLGRDAIRTVRGVGWFLVRKVAA